MFPATMRQQFGMRNSSVRQRLEGKRRYIVGLILLLLLIWVNSSTGPDSLSIDQRLETVSSQSSSTSSAATNMEKPPSFLQCLHDVLHDELPIGKGRRRKTRPDGVLGVFAHHHDAKNKRQWNMADRMKPMPVVRNDKDCSIWEVGAHVEAKDSRDFLKEYPHCKMHAYEPVPKYFAKLQGRWSTESRMTAHNYGLALEPSTSQVPVSALAGQSTFLGGVEEKKAGAGAVMTIEIKSFETAVEEAGGVPTLFHVNCEGCEWDMIPELAKSGFIEKIPLIQIGWHNYGKTLGARVWEFCEIREILSRTHDRISSRAFGWDRWQLKGRG